MLNKLPHLLICAAAIAVAGCAAPEALRGEFATITPSQAAAGATTPQRVRWGGTVLSMDNTSEGSCFEVLSRPLDAMGRPRSTDEEQGRFLACYAGYKEPEIYKPGRVVTIIGTLTGTEKRKVGEYDYSYPKLKADTVYLWQKEDRTARTYVVDPFFHPYPFYPYYYRTYYYAPAPGPRPPPPPSEPPSLPDRLVRPPVRGL